MREVDMRKKICPIMNRTGNFVEFILCQGSACMAFGSRSTYEYLGKDGKPTKIFGDRTRFDLKIHAKLIEETVSLGWTKLGSPPGNPSAGVSFQRKTEPNCWCDAMAGNAQCGYEAP